jgi:hypothetical protein
MLAKNPGATAVAVISLAIAIGPNCAVFSVVDRLILKPPPVQGIGQIFDMNVRAQRPGEWQSTTYPDLLDYQAQAGDVASFAACTNKGAMLDTAGQRQIVPMQLVSENFFSVLGARAMAGRTLQESDARFAGQPPVVISYSLWQRYLGGARDAIGKTLFVTGQYYSLVGIMPRGFREPGLGLLPMDVWIPFSAAPAAERQDLMRRGSYPVGTLVRLRDGVDKARAEAVLTTVARRIASQYPDTYKGTAVTLENPEHLAVLGVIVLSLAGIGDSHCLRQHRGHPDGAGRGAAAGVRRARGHGRFKTSPGAPVDRGKPAAIRRSFRAGPRGGALADARAPGPPAALAFLVGL